MEKYILKKVSASGIFLASQYVCSSKKKSVTLRKKCVEFPQNDCMIFFTRQWIYNLLVIPIYRDIHYL